MRTEARNTWIVVADGGHARILLNTHRDEGVQELTLVNKHDPRLASHHGELAAGVHHAQGAVEKPSEGKFLSLLAETIQTGIARKEVVDVVLCAPATAMGLLRKALNTNSHKHVIAEIVHDYTHQENQAVWKTVRAKLPPL